MESTRDLNFDLNFESMKMRTWGGSQVHDATSAPS